jgi:hypothetical protein
MIPVISRNMAGSFLSEDFFRCSLDVIISGNSSINKEKAASRILWEAAFSTL